MRQFPLITNTVITVTTDYPGAPADLMQGFITTPIEQAVSGVEGLDYLTSTSIQGESTVVATIKLNHDPGTAMTDVMAKVQEVKYLLPKESNDPVITKETGQAIGIMYAAVTSSTMSSPALTDYITRVVQPMFTTVEGVAEAQVIGGEPFAMRLWLDPVAHGGARRHRRRRGQCDPRQQHPIGARSGKRPVRRHQRHGGYRPDRRQSIQANGGQVGQRRAGALERRRGR